MMMTRATFALLMLAFGVGAVADAPREVRGRVVDGRGEPVAGANVSTFWSANGLRADEIEKIQAGGGDGNSLFGREGQMVPHGEEPTMTDNDGRFTIRVEALKNRLMAIDSGCRRGGVASFDPADSPATVEITLSPLVRVTGSFRSASDPGRPDWTHARIYMPGDVPLSTGLATCRSLRSRFEFLLPPGEYELQGFASGPGDKPGDTSLFKTMPDLAFTVSMGKTEVNLGTVELRRFRHFQSLLKEAQSRGTFGDYRERSGRRPPKWYVTDAKGVRKDVGIEDFKGKWVLLYFWGQDCLPCMTETLPELSKFYEEHRSQRDKFEVLTFCLDVEGELKSMAELDRFLEPVVRNVWGGKPLPFPVLLDNTFRTAESFGLEGFGVKFLVDPQGNLVEGDEKVLSEKLRD